MKRFLRFFMPLVLAALPFAVSAQSKLLPPCTATGDCGVTDILSLLLNVAEYLIGITGAVALIMFVYGGFMFILAAGDKGKVGTATGILKNAVIGIVIIFLSGVLVRFATQALTGGVSAIPIVGESCDPVSQKSVVQSGQGAGGIWVSIPAGVDTNGKAIAEGLKCMKKETQATKSGDPCTNLNKELKARGRSETYSCKDVSSSSSCVRGLCSNLSPQYACCR